MQLDQRVNRVIIFWVYNQMLGVQNSCEEQKISKETTENDHQFILNFWFYLLREAVIIHVQTSCPRSTPKISHDNK